MKILHVVPTYLPATRYGGPIYSVHGLCRSLVSLGHDVHVFTTNVDGDGDSAVALGSPQLLDGVKIWYFPSGIARRLYWSPAMLRQMRVSLPSFDVVQLHSVFLWPTWVAARLAYRHDVPYVLSPRGMLVKELVRRKSRWLKMAWIWLIESRNIRRASLMHFTAGIERREFGNFRFSHRPYCIIPNGVDLPGDLDESKVSPDVREAIAAGQYLLFLGRLNWKKGLDRLLAALASLPGQRLLIVGNDEEGYLETIGKLVRDHDVQDRVTVIARFVTGADRQALYASASLFVLPSYSENFGNTVTEAMAVGCPVVVTEEVGAAELVRASGCGEVVAGRDLAAGIRNLLSQPDQIESRGRAGRDWVAHNLSWHRVAAGMLEQYGMLLDHRQS